MPYVYQTEKTKTDPETGKRVPVLDSKGNKVYHDRWRFEYVDWQGRRKNGTGGTTRRETEKLAARVQAEQDEIRKGYRPPPTSASKHASRPVKEVMAEYCEWGESQGGRGGRPWSKVHAGLKRSRLKWWRDRLGLETLADLDGILTKAETALRELQEKGRTGKTLMNYSEALKGFTRWAVSRGYLDTEPLKDLDSFDATPRTTRRAMTRDEIQRLLKAAPEYRRLLYAVALTTGLRAGELRALTVSDLNEDFCGINLRADITKNRKPGIQPVPRSVMDALIESVRDKGPDEPLLRIPSHLTRRMDYDLKKAGIPKWTPEGKIDFHACRVAYITFIIEEGANVKEAQELARHSTPNLTMNVYGKTRRKRRSELTDRVGDALLNGPDTGTIPERKAVGMVNIDISSGYGSKAEGSTPFGSTI